MNRIKISLTLSILFGIIGIFLIRSYMGSHQKLINNIYYPIDVVIAEKSLKKDSLLSRKDLSTQPIPQKFVSKDMFSKNDIDLLIGKGILKNLEAQEIILNSFIKKQGEMDSHTSIIDKDKRLVPFNENTTENFKELFNDRDRTDIILTYKNSRGFFVTKTILQNIEVRKFESRKESTDLESNLNAVYNSFLVMSPLESEIFTHALQKGKLNFIIRNSSDSLKVHIPTIDDRILLQSSPQTFPKEAQDSVEIISSAF